MAELRVVTVEIQGQQYPIKTSLDASYVHGLAAHVEARLQKAALSAPSGDAVGLAILTALNITDEYFRARTNGPRSRARWPSGPRPSSASSIRRSHSPTDRNADADGAPRRQPRLPPARTHPGAVHR